jgi:hypothetical protein
MESSLVDGGDDCAREFPLSAYCCIPLPAPLGHAPKLGDWGGGREWERMPEGKSNSSREIGKASMCLRGLRIYISYIIRYFIEDW